jgi:hypothetical protein
LLCKPIHLSICHTSTSSGATFIKQSFSPCLGMGFQPKCILGRFLAKKATNEGH